MPRVTSTVTNSVTCGAVNADAVMFCAVSLRTPFTGTRCSRDASQTAAAGPAATGAGDTGTATAVSTSARVIEPWGPEPVSADRSTPRSRASFRTGGLARTGPCPLADAVTPAGAAGATGGAGATTDGPATAAAGGGLAAGVPESVRRRGRRLAVVVRGP